MQIRLFEHNIEFDNGIIPTLSQFRSSTQDTEISEDLNTLSCFFTIDYLGSLLDTWYKLFWIIETEENREFVEGSPVKYTKVYFTNRLVINLFLFNISILFNFTFPKKVKEEDRYLLIEEWNKKAHIYSKVDLNSIVEFVQS